MAQFKKSFPNQYASMKDGNPYAEIAPQNQPNPKAHMVKKLVDALAPILISQKDGYWVFTSVPAEAIDTPVFIFDPKAPVQHPDEVFDIVICRCERFAMFGILCAIQVGEPVSLSRNLDVKQICVRYDDLSDDPSIASTAQRLAPLVTREHPKEPYILIPIKVAPYL